MPASGIKLPDANVWLALAFSDHVHHQAAKKWFETLVPESCAFCRITQLALLRHLTNSAIMGAFVQTQQQAWSAFESLAADPRAIFLHEAGDVDVQFRALTQDVTPSHGRWTDAYLAAFAIARNLQLVTFDKRLKVPAPLDILVLGAVPE